MGYYIEKYVLGEFTLKENITTNRRVSKAGENNIESKNLSSMKSETNFIVNRKNTNRLYLYKPTKLYLHV